MVKYFGLSVFFLIGLISCGVKKAPTPLYSIPSTPLSGTPTPSPSPGK